MAASGDPALSDAAGTDGFGLIDETVSVGLSVFDNVYATITGKKPVAVGAASKPPTPAPVSQTNVLLILAVVAVAYLYFRR